MGLRSRSHPLLMRVCRPGAWRRRGRTLYRLARRDSSPGWHTSPGHGELLYPRAAPEVTSARRRARRASAAVIFASVFPFAFSLRRGSTSRRPCIPAVHGDGVLWVPHRSGGGWARAAGALACATRVNGIDRPCPRLALLAWQTTRNDSPAREAGAAAVALVPAA